MRCLTYASIYIILLYCCCFYPSRASIWCLCMSVYAFEYLKKSWVLDWVCLVGTDKLLWAAAAAAANQVIVVTSGRASSLHSPTGPSLLHWRALKPAGGIGGRWGTTDRPTAHRIDTASHFLLLKENTQIRQEGWKGSVYFLRAVRKDGREKGE